MGKRKTPAGEEIVNYDFCEFLNELADYEKNVSRNIHKYNAYRKASSVLAAHPTRINSGQEAKGLNGIGIKIANKIDEFLETGKLQKLETIHNDVTNSAIGLLTRISGVGPVKAQALVNAGLTTIEKLKRHTDKLTHHQQIGLKYYEDFEKPVPRLEIQEIETILLAKLKKLDPLIQATICGSYRRGQTESGDIDVLITHPLHKSEQAKRNKNEILKKAVGSLNECKLITEIISLGESKFMGACKLGEGSVTRRLDIRFTPYDQYHCGMLYFTGSDMFNKEMRAHALENGFTLNEYSLRPVGCTGVAGEPVEVESERDIFDCIGFPYKEPEERNK